jgi:hypothetical protein
MQPAGPIDCDVHPTVPNLAALFPYLDDFWRETIRRRGLDELNTISYLTRSPLSARSDWRGKRGQAATSAPVSLRDNPNLFHAQRSCPVCGRTPRIRPKDLPLIAVPT